MSEELVSITITGDRDTLAAFAAVLWDAIPDSPRSIEPDRIVISDWMGSAEISAVRALLAIPVWADQLQWSAVS